MREALPRVLELCSGQLGWQMSLVWVPAENGEMHCLAAYAQPGREEQLALLSHETVTVGQGTVGHAWQRRQPVFVPGPEGPAQMQQAEPSSPPVSWSSRCSGTTGWPGWCR